MVTVAEGGGEGAVRGCGAERRGRRSDLLISSLLSPLRRKRKHAACAFDACAAYLCCCACVCYIIQCALVCIMPVLCLLCCPHPMFLCLLCACTCCLCLPCVPVYTMCLPACVPVTCVCAVCIPHCLPPCLYFSYHQHWKLCLCLLLPTCIPPHEQETEDPYYHHTSPPTLERLLTLRVDGQHSPSPTPFSCSVTCDVRVIGGDGGGDGDDSDGDGGAMTVGDTWHGMVGSIIIGI